MYLQLLEKNKIVPNFWCSEEYFEKAGWEEIEDDLGIIRIQDSEGINMLPSLPILPVIPYWASLPFKERSQEKFLDHNFIYDPKAFLNLSGGKWTVFRKNIKKFPVNKNLFYEELFGAQGGLEALSCWLNNRKADEVIHDDDVILKYVTDGKNKRFLFDNDNIYGVNIWDENYMFINYRYCFCQNIPFLSEYMRYRFYTDPEILNSGKKVNDGGSLDNPDLYKFKMRLNPEMVYNIYTTL
ncbi:MAG: hypothetical protein M0P71_12905 [Melioribacteraceae bacterium]|jgi:hypothetical protein|nr:hypothetical protein [Melioribacteraceae bacterium]